MESRARLYQCMLCHKQVIICCKCDRGNIYCADGCAILARKRSLKQASARYQATFNGKRHNAARQARFRNKHKKIVTHHSSLSSSKHDSINPLENKPKDTEKKRCGAALICHFCKKSVSDLLRYDFLHQRISKKLTGLRAYSQAP